MKAKRKCREKNDGNFQVELVFASAFCYLFSQMSVVLDKYVEPFRGGTDMPNKHTHFSVKNVSSTSGRQPPGPSWLDRLKELGGSQRKTCAVLGCTRTDVVGAHVQIADKRHTKEQWIAPLCKGHNHYTNKDEMFLDSRTKMVSANVNKEIVISKK